MLPTILMTVLAARALKLLSQLMLSPSLLRELMSLRDSQTDTMTILQAKAVSTDTVLPPMVMMMVTDHLTSLEEDVTRTSTSPVKANILDMASSALMLAVKIPILTLIRSLLTFVTRTVTTRTRSMVRRTSVLMTILMPVASPVSPVDPAEMIDTEATAIASDMVLADMLAMVTTEKDHHTTEELVATPTPSDTTEVLSHPRPAVVMVKSTLATPDRDLLMMLVATDVVPADTDQVSESSKASVEAAASRVSTLSPPATDGNSAMAVTATDNSLTADLAMDSSLATESKNAMAVTATDNSCLTADLAMANPALPMADLLMVATVKTLLATDRDLSVMDRAILATDTARDLPTILMTVLDTEAPRLLSQLMPSLSSLREEISPRDSQIDTTTISLRIELEDTDTDIKLALMVTMMATDHLTFQVEDVTRTSTSPENLNNLDTVSSALMPDVKTLTSTPTRNPLTTVMKMVITRTKSMVRRISAPMTTSMPAVSLASLVAPVKVTVATAIATDTATRLSHHTEDGEYIRLYPDVMTDINLAHMCTSNYSKTTNTFFLFIMV